MTRKQEEQLTVIAYRMPSLMQMYRERLDELNQRYTEAAQEKGEDDVSVLFCKSKSFI